MTDMTKDLDMQNHIPKFDYTVYEGKIIQKITNSNEWLKIIFTDGSSLSLRLMDEITLDLLYLLKQVMQT